MVKFELLSDNLVNILRNTVDNQNIAKYLSYPTAQNPLAKTTVLNTRTLMSGDTAKVFPFPFSLNMTTDETIQIHIYYPETKISNRIVQNTKVFFDVVCHKNLWLFNDGTPGIRPWKIATELMNTFDERVINHNVKLTFDIGKHLIFNDNFQALSFAASMTEASSSQPNW